MSIARINLSYNYTELALIVNDPNNLLGLRYYYGVNPYGQFRPVSSPA